MPHAALWVVQQNLCLTRRYLSRSFNAARGFVGGAAHPQMGAHADALSVSMPHAALWVVQRSLHRLYHSRDYAK